MEINKSGKGDGKLDLRRAGKATAGAVNPLGAQRKTDSSSVDEYNAGLPNEIVRDALSFSIRNHLSPKHNS